MIKAQPEGCARTKDQLFWETSSNDGRLSC